MKLNYCSGGGWGESLAWFCGAVGVIGAAASCPPVVIVCACYEIGYWGARVIKEI